MNHDFGPYAEGWRAYKDVKVRSTNPYPDNTWQRQEWFRGWDDAKAASHK